MGRHNCKVQIHKTSPHRQLFDCYMFDHNNSCIIESPL